MTWNYRILERVEEEGTVTQGLYEVYYDDGEPVFCTKDPVGILWDKGENFLVLRNQLMRAFEEPVLHYDDFNNKEVF